MSLTPTKHRQITRQRSSPSLAKVGLAPTPSETSYILPSYSPKQIRRQRSQPRIHRGDVSSTASSASDSEDPTTPTKETPKRRVIGAMETMTPGRPKASRPNLQARLQAAAKVRTSQSMDTIPPVPALPSLPTTPSKSRLVHSASSHNLSPEKPRSRSDKVLVCVRIKPPTSTFPETAYEATPTSLTLSDAHPNVVKRGGKAGREDEYVYSFDALLQYPSKTPELYTSKIAPLVDKAMNGFNSTIFAYGQTGSGKSFTMTGVPEELGVIPCAVDGVFDAINAEPDREYLLRVSYIEIYNETLRDLLNPKKVLRDDEKPVIHTRNGKVYVDPLVEEVVSTPQEVVDLLERGNTQRKVGATDWNERSSRSHSVFTIVIESRPRNHSGGDDIRLSRLNLIDLAGSEKAVSDAERRGEGKHINKSLLALREVINKLTDKKRTHVPYRDSKLTHLLENALGGDSNICVICTMSAEEAHCSETLETLKFAGRCSQVETRAKKNILLSNDKALIQAKDREIEDLKNRLIILEQDPRESIPSTLADSVASMEERKRSLTAQLARLNAEILTSEVLPRSTSGLPLSPKPKRRRISDFHMVGLGTPKKMADRRAVSNMVRVTEETEVSLMATVMETVPAKAFEEDRKIAALRRELAEKKVELAEAKSDLDRATSLISDRDSRLDSLQGQVDRLTAEREGLQASVAATRVDRERAFIDLQTQLEATRAELVSVVNDKTAKIDQLEDAILELRKSREDLVVEDQERYDGVKAELSAALDQCEIGKAAQQRVAELESDLNTQAMSGNESQAKISRLEQDLEALSRQHAEQLAARSAESGAIIAALRHELETSRQSNLELNKSLSTAQAEIAAAHRGQQEARDDLDRFQKATMENESTQATELKSQIAQLRQGAEEDRLHAASELAVLRKALEGEQSRCATLEQEKANHLKMEEVTNAAQAEHNRVVEEVKRQLDEERKEKAALGIELETLRAHVAQMERQVADLASTKQNGDDASQRLREELDHFRSESSAALDRQRKEHEVVVVELETAHTQLRNKLEIELHSSKAASSEQSGLVEALRRDLESQEARLAASEEAKALLQATLDQALQREIELKASQSSATTLELERLTKLEADLASHRDRADEAVSSHATVQVQLKEATERESALGQKLQAAEEAARLADALSVEVESQRTQAQAAVTTAKELQARLDEAIHREKTLRETTTKMSEAEQTIRAQVANIKVETTKAIAESVSRAENAEREVQSCKEFIEVLEKSKADMLVASAKDNTKGRDLEVELHNLRSELEVMRKAHASCDATSKRLVEAETRLKAHVEQLASMDIDNKALRQALDLAQEELGIAKAKALTSSDKAHHLARELAEVKASTARSRHVVSASDPSAPSSTTLTTLRAQALTSASTGNDVHSANGKLLVKEVEEIDRLEKVVEAQKLIIDDQKEKIKFWARELEQQREIVRALTMNPESPPRVSPRGHVKAKSMSVVDSPRDSTPKKPFPSTFTAFNLALPTTPTPLPMHPSQFDNTSGRKGRRLTIDHDMNLLSDSSKVNRARAKFERHDDIPPSPSKTPVGHKRTGSEMIRSVPKQRRP